MLIQCQIDFKWYHTDDSCISFFDFKVNSNVKLMAVPVNINPISNSTSIRYSQVTYGIP